jgi:hypothetical protein
MAHEIAGLTTCLLCGKTFGGPAAIVIGSSRTDALLEKLAKHLHAKHPEVRDAIDIMKLQMDGAMQMMNFRTTDTALMKQVDVLRWSVNQQTLPCRISDENIEARTKEIATAIALEARDKEISKQEVWEEFETSVHARLKEVFTALRNAMQEPGKYKAVNLADRKPDLAEGLTTPN